LQQITHVGKTVKAFKLLITDFNREAFFYSHYSIHNLKTVKSELRKGGFRSKGILVNLEFI
jgi:hypothetical protein